MRGNPNIGEPIRNRNSEKKATAPVSSPNPPLSISETERERTAASRAPKGQERDKPQKELASQYVDIGQKITVTVCAHDKNGLSGNSGNYPVYIPREEIEEGSLPSPSQLTAYKGKTLEVEVIGFGCRGEMIIASRKALLQKKKSTPIPSMPRQPKKTSKDQVTAPKEIKVEGYPVQIDADGELPSELKNIANGEEFIAICNGFRESGLTAEWNGYSVFIPDTEIATSYVYNLSAYMGDLLCLRASRIYYTENRREIIASRRVIIEKKSAFFESIHEGDVVEGKVERVTSFGAFVSVNGFDCLAHISDLSWSGVKSVTDVLEIGKRYEFKVLNVDRENKKVSIGYKQLQPQPWDLAAEKYAEGDVVHGKVVRIVPVGAFVELEKGVDGLVHVSQITHEWLENPTAALSIGEEVDAKILAFNPAERKITLSIKALQEQPEEPERRERPERHDDHKDENK